MFRIPITLMVSAIILLTETLGVADQTVPTEARLREALRNTVVQLRSAQNDGTALQTANGELDRKNKELDAQVQHLTKSGAVDRETAEKTIANLNAKAVAQAAEIAKLGEALAQCQAKLTETAALAQSMDRERARLASAIIVLDRTMANQRSQNIELYKLGREILLRYEKFGLGEVIGGKEPFVGTMRVKMETYVQDFQDKLTDQKIKP